MERHRPRKLLDQVRDAVCLPCCRRTVQTLFLLHEAAQVGWNRRHAFEIKRYICFHDVRHPSETLS
jgi:hypothetical protein